MATPAISYARTLRDVTQRIVSTAKPQRIILFGSSARKTRNRDSDIDLLVIVRGPVHRRQLAQKIYRNLHGIGLPVDVIVATEDDIEKHGNQIGTILRPALKEGKVLYDSGN
jgi:predicted nucleotidyltransferase